MKGKRAVLAQVVHALRLDNLARTVARSYGTNTLTVVNYHRVNEPEAVRAFDEGTLDATAESFSQQIAFLKREYSLLDPKELRAHLAGRKPWPRRTGLITFDDGYRDNRDRAASILDQLGAKAIFFVASDYLTQRRVFWWDRISYILKHSKRTRLVIGCPQKLEIDLNGGTTRAERQLHQLVKRDFGLDFQRFFSELSEAANVDWTESLERQFADELLMSWEHVRALNQAGMTIGSHTRSHRVLDTIPESELDIELAGSRRDIEAQIGAEVWAIAYPVGYTVSNVPSIRAALERAGYEVGFVYNRQVQRLDNFDLFDVGRLAVERDWDLARYSSALMFAACR